MPTLVPRCEGVLMEKAEHAQSPITQWEMKALLDPLQICLQRLERTVQELSTSQRQQQQQQQQLLPSPLNIERQPSNSSGERAQDPMNEVALDDCKTNALRLQASWTSLVDSCDEAEAHEDKPELLEHFQIDEVLKADGLGGSATVLDAVAVKLEKEAELWSQLKEPKRNNILYRVASSSYFEALCLCVIIVNSVLVAYTADWQVRNIGSKVPQVLDVLEKCCFAWFVFELTVRMLAHRLYFFVNSDMQWNIFDLILVTISVISFILASAAEDTESSNVGFMRLLRLLKLAKIFRSLRAFRFVKSLEMMLESLKNSIVSLFWGFVMLAFILYLFSLIFLQAVTDYITSGYGDSSKWQRAMHKFGSLGTTFLSLYMSVTGGDDWGKLYDILSPTGWTYSFLLVFFTFFFLFALFNILTGTLVEKSMAVSKPERTDTILKQRKLLAEEKHTFTQLCNAMDKDGNRVISWSEFQQWMDNPIMFAYMSSIGIDIYDVELFFKTVGAREAMSHKGKDMKEGAITIPHFVEGCMHMKGSATALDMQRQLFEIHLLHHAVKSSETYFNERLKGIEELIASKLR